MTAHKHAALMQQYAQDWAETEVLRVKEYIGYEPETGRLFWKKKRGRDAYVSAKRKLHVGCTL